MLKYLLSIPAKNEAATVGNVITDFIATAKNLNISLQVQVIDDGSQDNTSKEVEDMGIVVHKIITSKGLANAFAYEMKMAVEKNCDFIIHVDADGQHSAEDLYKFIAKAEEGYDLVLGNRLHSVPNGMSGARYLANISLSSVVSSIINKNVSDSQTGYRLISKKLAEACHITSNYTYTQELILRAAKGGFSISEVPINAIPRYVGSSKIASNGLKYLAAVYADLATLTDELFPERVGTI